MAKRILDVGQCGFDGPRIRGLLKDSLGAQVDVARTSDEAVSKLEQNKYDLVLVNRIFASDGGSGVELIGQVAQRPDAPPIMLVSDREDAQQEAQSLGAVPGFGKSELYDESTVELIQNAMK